MFTSGTWTAFWTAYPDWAPPAESAHSLELTFADGRVSGEGTDWVGEFVIGGTYDEATQRVAYTKAYVGKHSIEYTGQRDAEGNISGEWQLGPFRGFFLLVPRPVREATAVAEPWHSDTVRRHKAEFEALYQRAAPPVQAAPKRTGCFSVLLLAVAVLLWRVFG
jgi:hypothetical protein